MYKAYDAESAMAFALMNLGPGASLQKLMNALKGIAERLEGKDGEKLRKLLPKARTELQEVEAYIQIGMGLMAEGRFTSEGAGR